MPTARPTISASTGAVEMTSKEPATVNTPAIAIPTPTSAVTSGSPAATSDPRVTTRTSPATIRPITSPPSTWAILL